MAIEGLSSNLSEQRKSLCLHRNRSSQTCDTVVRKVLCIGKSAHSGQHKQKAYNHPHKNTHVEISVYGGGKMSRERRSL